MSRFLLCSLHYEHNVIYKKKSEVMTIAKKKEFNQSRYIQDFMRSRYIRLQILLSKETDTDIIEKLNQQPNKSEYVKRLIRQDLHK